MFYKTVSINSWDVVDRCLSHQIYTDNGWAIPELCFIFHFTSLPLEVVCPIQPTLLTKVAVKQQNCYILHCSVSPWVKRSAMWYRRVPRALSVMGVQPIASLCKLSYGMQYVICDFSRLPMMDSKNKTKNRSVCVSYSP